MTSDDPLAGYEGVVYDLDGTLVRLAVDWDTVHDDVRELYAAAGIEADGSLWDLLGAARDHGIADSVASTVANHERIGARQSRRLPIADELDSLDRPVAICSLNCEAACEIALETHDLAAAVDVIVGRDTIPEQKPAPEPLFTALDGIGVGPDEAVFVGDSESDGDAAEAAGLDFQFVTEGQR